MLAVIIMVAVIYLFLSEEGKEEKPAITIAVLQDNLVQNYNTNYYTEWLETATGYDLQFEYILKGYEQEYINACLTSAKGKVDAIFLPEKENILTNEEFQRYVDAGLVLDLSKRMTKESNYTSLLGRYESISLREQIEYNNAIYYMPNMDTSRRIQNMQVMWMNVGWLKTLGLKVPTTVEELEIVLKAFQENDPNKNRLRDELPLISCDSSYSLQSYNYILNAYIYYDPIHQRQMLDERGNVVNITNNPNYREGLKFCENLRSKGLLTDQCNDFSKRQLMELVNAQGDYVGAFTSQSIADVIYPNCPDILARFIQVPPLRGPKGEQNAIYCEFEPTIGGFIPSNSQHADETFEIMDLMLSKEASLIASFGEEGVDWKFSDAGDLSTFGTQAFVTTIKYINDVAQNKHYAGAGPLVLDAEYANGITWNGNNSLVEYLDARAVSSYEKYYKKNVLSDRKNVNKVRQYEVSHNE